MDSMKGSTKSEPLSVFVSLRNSTLPKKEPILYAIPFSKEKQVGAQARAGTDETNSEMVKWCGLEPKEPPLLNDVILSVLFEFMGVKDLKNCRLVCKKWCVASLPAARSKFQVKLIGDAVEMPTRLTNCVEMLRQNTLGVPFVMYILDPCCTTEGPGQEFLQMCGSSAKTVILGQGYLDDVSAMAVEDISELLKFMPNIEHFVVASCIKSKNGKVVKLFPDESSSKPTLTFLKKLHLYDMDPDKKSQQCPTFVEELLSVAPNITDFFVDDVKYDPERSRIGQVLKAIEKFERGPIIRSLSFFSGQIEHLESIQELAENGMKLKSFDFSCFFSETQDADPGLSKFLPVLASFFKNSVGRFNVDEVCHDFLELPILPKLKTLELNISRDFDTKCVNLKKLCPALKELELYYWRSDNDWEWETFLPNSEPCPNVKSFTVQGFMKIQIFDHMLNIFPTLTKLHLDVKPDGAQILRKIMTQMTQLEDLCVNGTVEGIESIDAFLIGIPVEGLQQLELLVNELKEMSVELRAQTIQQYRTLDSQLPSISNLTNLKQLSLNTTGRVDAEARETRMTEVFMFFGLYSMKHINRLEIADCEFTKAGCEILTAEMGLESWSFQAENDVEIIPGGDR